MNVENLCDAMNMSRSSLYNKIKALTNDSPSDFIRKVRMNEASILLKSKRYTVSEVSDMMGFSVPNILRIHLRNTTEFHQALI